MFSYQLLLTELFGTMFLTSLTILTIKKIENRIVKYALQMLILFTTVFVCNELHGKGFVNPLIAIVILISTHPIHLTYVIPMEFVGFIFGFLLVNKIKQIKFRPHKVYKGYKLIPIFGIIWLLPIAIIAKYHFNTDILNFAKAAFVASANLYITKMIFYNNEINLHNPIFGVIKICKKDNYELTSYSLMFVIAIIIGALMLLL